MDYKKEIIEMIQNCNNQHWLKVIFTYLKALLKY